VHEEEDITAQGNQTLFQSQDSGTHSKRYKLSHRRGKSETLRAQYINTKEIRHLEC
jgi:hypothetical protein